MVTFRGATFPLPLRDSRNINAAVVTAPVTQVAELTTFFDVPLPRRRPAAPGETPKPVAVAAPVAAATAQPERIVQFGNKRVRVVGPSTPYAPQVAAGT